MKETLLYKIVRPVISFLVKVFLRVKIVNKEYIPTNGKVILAGTHTNNLDCLVLMASTKRCIHFLAKNDLIKGQKKIIFTNMGIIPVDREKKDHQAIPMSLKCLEKNQVVGIFPEGTTEKGRGLLPFKIGTVKIAKESNSKIVPFIIKGKYRLFSNDLKIVFKEPIEIKSNDLEKENKKFEELIKKMLEDNRL